MSEIACDSYIVCPACGGDGIVSHEFGGEVGGQERPCDTCGATGKISAGKVIIDLSDIEDKLDSIIAEQASQREDLTNALTNIIGKCNDILAAVS